MLLLTQEPRSTGGCGIKEHLMQNFSKCFPDNEPAVVFDENIMKIVKNKAGDSIAAIPKECIELLLEVGAETLELI